MAQSISFRAEIDDYTNRVLGVIKEKFGLKGKSQALNKFAKMFGEEFIEKEVKEELIRDMIKACEKWEKRYKFKRKMSIKELDKLTGIES